MSKKVSSGYLSVRAEDILAEMYSDSEMCVGYRFFDGGKSKENVEAIKELKANDMLEFYRGLMNDDGEVCGSGWCRSKKGNDYVEEYQL